MALTQINSYSNVGNDDLDNLMLSNNKLFIGHDKLILTEMDTDTIPEIAAGSIIEVGGALLMASTDEFISTTDPVTDSTVADGTVYVCIDGTEKLVYFTATPPTWSDTKQGWYGTGDQANYRYVPVAMTKSSTDYLYKRKFENRITEVTNNWPKLWTIGSSTQVAENSSAYLNLNANVQLDNRNALSSTYYTLPEDGYYEIAVSVEAGHTSEAESLAFYFYLYDGSNMIGDTVHINMNQAKKTSSSTDNASNGAETIIKYFTAGTTIYVRATNPPTGALDAYANVVALSIKKIP